MRLVRTDIRVLRHGVGQLLLWSGLYYQLPALLPHMRGGGLDGGWLSGAITAAILIWAILVPWVGQQVDKGNGTKVMRLGGSLGVVLLVAMTMVPASVVPLLVAGLGVTMAATLYDPCFAILLKTPGLDAGRAITTVTLIAGMATLLSFPLAQGLAAHWSWQAVLLAFASLVAIGTLIIPTSSQGDAGHDRADVQEKAWPAWPDIALIAVPFGLSMFSHAVIVFLLPLALLAQNGESLWVLYLPAVLGPAQIAGRLLWRQLSLRSSPVPAASALFSLMSVPPLLLLLDGIHWLFVLFALLVQGGLYGVHTVLRPMVAAAVLPRPTLGHALGMIATVGLLMMAAAPALGGLLHQTWGYQGLVSTLILVNLVALALSLGGQHYFKRRHAWAR